MSLEMRLLRWWVWGVSALAILLLGLLWFAWSMSKSYQPFPVYGEVTDFRLTNQIGQAVTLGDLKGQIWVADIIFTRCPGPCLQMTQTMKVLATKLSSDLPVKLISLTADPKFDTPAVLRAYATRFQSDPQRWQFLTGPKAEVYGLAMKGLKLGVDENQAGTSIEDQFVHSTRFVLVDRQGRIRNVSFDGTHAGTAEQMARAIRQLLDEPSA